MPKRSCLPACEIEHPACSTIASYEPSSHLSRPPRSVRITIDAHSVRCIHLPLARAAPHSAAVACPRSTPPFPSVSCSNELRCDPDLVRQCSGMLAAGNTYYG
ncbi:hypothetical protein PENSPDRAFT_428433 [Peniophora sp. CONT]|nr:hypothetical protein PENSPDRAFT_428433 [Peniophora sp. CONT]